MQTSSDFLLRGSLKIKKGLATSFQFTYFAEFYNEDFSFVILHELAKFALFSKTNFLFHGQAFDDAMKFKIPKF